MKFLTLLMFFTSMFVFTNKATARSKEDTIYYLLDTINTPVRDRIITIEEDGFAKFLNINCHCLKDYEIPVFRYEAKQAIPLKRKVFKKLKLLTLVRLMELSRAGNSTDFKIRHVFYIIEPKGKDYVIYRAMATGGEKITGY